jgi:hypothetical protein
MAWVGNEPLKAVVSLVGRRLGRRSWTRLVDFGPVRVKTRGALSFMPRPDFSEAVATE